MTKSQWLNMRRNRRESWIIPHTFSNQSLASGRKSRVRNWKIVFEESLCWWGKKSYSKRLYLLANRVMALSIARQPWRLEKRAFRVISLRHAPLSFDMSFYNTILLRRYCSQSERGKNRWNVTSKKANGREDRRWHCQWISLLTPLEPWKIHTPKPLITRLSITHFSSHDLTLWVEHWSLRRLFSFAGINFRN